MKDTKTYGFITAERKAHSFDWRSSVTHASGQCDRLQLQNGQSSLTSFKKKVDNQGPARICAYGEVLYRNLHHCNIYRHAKAIHCTSICHKRTDNMTALIRYHLAYITPISSLWNSYTEVLSTRMDHTTIKCYLPASYCCR